MRYGLSMKQVCPLYRVQFKFSLVYGIILATDRQTDRQIRAVS